MATILVPERMQEILSPILCRKPPGLRFEEGPVSRGALFQELLQIADLLLSCLPVVLVMVCGALPAVDAVECCLPVPVQDGSLQGEGGDKDPVPKPPVLKRGWDSPQRFGPCCKA